MKKFFLIAGLIFCVQIFAQQPILFEVNVFVKQNVDLRKKAMLKKMQQTYRKNYSTMALWHTIRKVFDVPFMCNERQVRTEFFKFLSGITLPQHYPVVMSEGYTLPPLMAAWSLGKISVRDAMQRATDYVNAQQCPDEHKKFYRALLYTTFDAEVARNTRLINVKAEKLLDMCRAKGYHVYLIGHCDDTAQSWLREKAANLLAKFDKILFSSQVAKLPETKFYDAWWLAQLGLNLAASYIYVSDWSVAGAKGDAPPHYASTSKTLQKMLTNVAQ